MSEHIRIDIKPSLDSIKNKFFSGDHDGFLSELTIRQKCRSCCINRADFHFKFYSATYKYSEDYIGKAFSDVDKLLNELILQLHDKREYLFAAFTYNKVDDKYIITSYWIINSNSKLFELVPKNICDKFDWHKLDSCEIYIRDIIVENFVNKSKENSRIFYLH